MTTALNAPTRPDPGGPLETIAVEVMRELRAAFLGLIEGIPPEHAQGGIRRAQDLVRVLGVSRTLAWQVHRVATSPNPLTVGADVPGIAAVKQVLNAARSRGVAEKRVLRVVGAMEALDALVDQHADDRRAFAAMIGSLAGEEPETIDLKTRRQAFRALREVWGVQATTVVACAVNHPGSSAATMDHVSIHGTHGIRRLRAGTPLRVASCRQIDAQMQPVDCRALDGSAPGPGLMLEYCSLDDGGCPELDHRDEDGYRNTYLRETPLGNTGARSFYFCGVTRDFQWRVPDEPPILICTIAVTKPVEALVLDTLFHRGMFGAMSPKVRVYGALHRLGGTIPERFGEDETLPMEAAVHNLGFGLSALPTAHIPRYAEMVGSACGVMGWDADEFEVFRCVVEYPVLSSVVSVRFDLSDARGG